MLSLYRSADGPWQRAPAGRKTVLIVVLVLAVSLVPAEPLWVAVAAAVGVACYAVPGVGLGVLRGQIASLRWVLVLTLVGQAIFLGPVPAVLGTVRIAVAISLAGLLALTTPVTALLDVSERALGILRPFGVDPARIALLLVVAIGSVPVLARHAREVREAQRARGAGRGVGPFAVPFLILALRHADQLGDALTARGVR